ncbi:hypothetical protein Tco_1162688 [Tanacetum coccineum]
MEYARNQNEGKVVEHPAVEVAVNNMLEPEIDSQILTAFMEVDPVFNPGDVDNDVEARIRRIFLDGYDVLVVKTEGDKDHTYTPVMTGIDTCDFLLPTLSHPQTGPGRNTCPEA